MKLSRIAWALALFSQLTLSPAASAAEPLTSVRTEPFSALAIHPTLSAPAQVISLNDSRIESSLAATVAAIPVRVGDVVEAGAELLRLECDDQRNILQQSEAGRDALKARLEFAQFQYARARSLVKSKNISDEQLNQRKADAQAIAAELAGAEAALAKAGRDVTRCSVTAPFNAVVMERLIGVGEKSAPGKPLLRLLDLSALEVSAQVQSVDADSLQHAEELGLIVDGRSYPLALRYVLPALAARSRSREVRLDFATEAPPPGSSGRLQWREYRPHLPAELLLRRDGKYGVFIVREGKAEFIVAEEAREGSPVYLPMPPQTRVVTEGRYGLSAGDTVNALE